MNINENFLKEYFEKGVYVFQIYLGTLKNILIF